MYEIKKEEIQMPQDSLQKALINSIKYETKKDLRYNPRDKLFYRDPNQVYMHSFKHHVMLWYDVHVNTDYKFPKYQINEHDKKIILQAINKWIAKMQYSFI